MLISFPQPPPGPLGAYLVRVFESLRKALSHAVASNEASSQIILRSPNGTTYNVTVSDAGSLTTALNDGKTRPG